MTGPLSAPRAERAGIPGANWEAELVWNGEQIVGDGQPGPRASRAARRAAAKQPRGKKWSR